MKTFTLITVILSCITINSLAQIKTESVDIIDIPQTSYNSKLNVSITYPLIIVMIDSIEYELDSLSFNYIISDSLQGITLVNNVDENWVQSITVLEDSKAKEKYGYKGNNGVTIIRLLDNHKKDFIDGKKTTAPIKLKRFNKQQSHL